MKVLLIGIQGAGKSTQGNFLSEKLNLPYLSTGHIFRELSKDKSVDGRFIKETINAGFLVPDELTIRVVNEYLQRPEYRNGYILDGFPRTIQQAKSFHEKLDKAFYLKVSDKEALWRLAGRDEYREDETLKAIKKRIDLFHEVTEPILDFYRQVGILVEVDGEKTISEVSENIYSHLN
ncbi:MAG: hypothetical protein A2798_01290 [Candidatus Levybacteria bacterium RIFCSPHIGHO2_01_FULL_37_17]|nr:MAG: hypothetical protein A2798_01290 [Candidatus Levybacteria bacterium RIFCSPHIGHO2_01_FULL_37_17]OGH37085.1 MAG: hypothetical protein A2959_02150 [Candidatus Levybacteria bacterium RIFCSPLOWO2_01_FULL_38_23]